MKNRSKSQVSIKDVASYVGVSPTTVSRVINNSDHPVNSKTKAAVKKAIRELNYHPNRMAQGLKKNKSGIIGVIVHDISDEYFAELVKGIEKITFTEDYIVNIFNTERDIYKELRAVEMLKATRAEAIVFTGGNLLDDYYHQEMKRIITDLKSQGCFIISVTTHPFDVMNIKIGNRGAAGMITEYIVGKGHTDIAYINGPEILNTTRERLEGFKEILKKEEISIQDNLIFSGDFTFEGGRRAAENLVEYIDNITAVVAANDETALGLIWELDQKGYQVPDDISVVGIGNIPASRYSHPPLTTVSLPLATLGEEIGHFLVNKLQGEKDLTEVINPEVELVERKSVKRL